MDDAFFASRVASLLASMGHDPDGVIAPLLLRRLCAGLKASGYDAEHAALLIGNVFKGDAEALQDLHRDSGVPVTSILGPIAPEEPDAST